LRPSPFRYAPVEVAAGLACTLPTLAHHEAVATTVDASRLASSGGRSDGSGQRPKGECGRGLSRVGCQSSARCEDPIRATRTGLHNLPYVDAASNAMWSQIVPLALDCGVAGDWP